jgi:hypothetical protein
MKECPYCGYANQDTATACRKCEGSSLRQAPPAYYRTYRAGPEKAREIRRGALSAIILGLMIKVYWGGYGPWPVIDYPPRRSIRPPLEPALLGGGVLLYLAGWVLKWI